MTEEQQATLEDSERQPCEVWTRCMGYHRPVDAWNPGKRQEHADRQVFSENPTGKRGDSYTNQRGTKQ